MIRRGRGRHRKPLRRGGGRGVSGGLVRFLLTRPYERFTIHGSTDITTAILLLAVGLAVSQLAAQARLVAVTLADQTGRAVDSTSRQVADA